MTESAVILPRRLALGLVFAMAVQFGGVVWWAATINGKIERIELEQSRYSSLTERLATIETNVAWIRRELERDFRPGAGGEYGR